MSRRLSLSHTCGVQSSQNLRTAPPVVATTYPTLRSFSITVYATCDPSSDVIGLSWVEGVVTRWCASPLGRSLNHSSLPLGR